MRFDAPYEGRHRAAGDPLRGSDRYRARREPTLSWRERIVLGGIVLAAIAYLIWTAGQVAIG